MRYFTQSLTLMGHVTNVTPASHCFTIHCRSGDVFEIHTSETTAYRVLKNLDGLDRDRVAKSADGLSDAVARQIARYVHPGRLIVVHGVYQDHAGQRRFDARIVHLVHSLPDGYLFEETHWWLTQVTRLADEWLEDIFGDRRSYRVDDFAAFYRTNLNLYGQPGSDTTQECATLSRLIYGFSSVYLLTGAERYFLAAKAGVEYQRQSFRRFSHDGQYCFWSHARRKVDTGAETIEPSMFGDDLNTIPLYEQIYALAGLAQYYRITLDWEVLEEMRRTVNAFRDFYLDDDVPRSGEKLPSKEGYFSHLDYATMRPDAESLTAERDNRLRKNWNSIGDHIPAYLVNLLIALDPLPEGRSQGGVSEFRDHCRWMLDETSRLIAEKFLDRDGSVFVNERFHADWSLDNAWGWQQDRGIVGHNLKIAWNLTRCANYFECEAARVERRKGTDRQCDEEIAYYRRRANQCVDAAVKLADRMAEVGVDQIRGGVFDALERHPKNGMPMEFAWLNTKDFWQQEQGLLAFLILHGYCRHDPEYRQAKRFLTLARETAAFWNLFFLDLDRRGIFFRVTDNGLPIVEGSYANKAGHSISGYHVFELNYLAHLYTRAFVGQESRTDDGFCLYFRPAKNCGQRSINVLPDFFRPGDVRISGISVNGVRRPNFDPENFQVPLDEQDLGGLLIVDFCACPGKTAAEGTGAVGAEQQSSETVAPQNRCRGL